MNYDNTWHLDIPKIAHFFWDNRPLSFLRWLSLKSFSALNPDWKIKLHVTEDSVSPSWKSGNNKHQQSEFDDARKYLGDIERLFVVKESLFPDLHGVQQSDILRNKFLFEDGGLWSDIDILYYRPMSKVLCNIPEYSNNNMGLCITKGWFPIAFMLAKRGAPFFQAVYEHQIEITENQTRRQDYQKFGTNVFRYSLRRGQFPFFVVAPEEVYQHRWRQHASIFQGAVNLDLGVGIHWYGGSDSAAKAEAEITHANWRKHGLAPIIERSFK